MKNTVEVIVVRVNGEVKTFQGLNDCYTNVQLNVYKEWLSEDEINYLRDKRRWYEYDTYFYNEQEAKDLCENFGNLKIGIEEVEICFKKYLLLKPMIQKGV